MDFYPKFFLELPGRIYLIVFLSIVFVPAFAETDTLFIGGQAGLGDRLDISKYIDYYIDSTGKKPFSEVRSKAVFKPFIDYPHERNIQSPVWIRLTIRNTALTEEITPKLFLGNRKIDYMYDLKNGVLRFNNFGKGTSMQHPTTTTDQFAMRIVLFPGEQGTFWVRNSPLIFAVSLEPILFTEESYDLYKNEHAYGKMFHFGYLCLIMGLCLFLGLFAFVQSVYAKDSTYFFWALYLWSNFIMFFTATEYAFRLNLITNEEKPWAILAQYVVQLAYLLFLNSFLQIKKHDKRTFNIIRILIVILVGAMVFAFYAIMSLNHILRLYADMFTFLTDFVILFLFIRIVRIGIPQTNLLVIGSIGVLLTAVVAAVFDQFDLNRFGIFWLDPIITFSIGVVFELIFFSLALSRRTLLIQQENQRLQQNYTKQLEQDLAKRITTIQSQNSLLEEQRVQRLTNEFEQKIAETEITALRSQMNPHFIFNCLNSIKLYTMENKSEAASDYLTKFSRLIRLVLENSRSEKVTLENELETLSLYAEMEMMRFKNKVQFILKVSPEIDQLFVEIPPLLLQPFVENAIWHGLMHKEEGGTVEVDVSMASEKILHVEIFDNGVGRAQSAEYKSKSATVNKSFGMKVTNERIELINQIYKTTTYVKIVDLTNEAGIGIGTKVVLEIPV